MGFGYLVHARRVGDSYARLEKDGRGYIHMHEIDSYVGTERDFPCAVPLFMFDLIPFCQKGPLVTAF